MKTSEQVNEIFAAYSKAQSAFEAAMRDHKAKVETKTGGSYEFSYADFAAYVESCRAALGANGLSFLQEATRKELEVSVITRLVHCSGQWVETEPLSVPLIPDSRGAITAQIVGSGVTYCKRYSLSALLGLASEFDDDGNAACGNHAEIERRAALPACPECGHNHSVIVGKPEYGGGMVCFKKKGGCGHNWHPEAEPAAEPPKETKPRKERPLPQPTSEGPPPDRTPQQRFNDAVQLMAAASDPAKINQIMQGAKSLLQQGVFTQLMAGGIVQTGYGKLAALVEGDLACDELLTAITKDHHAGLLSYDQLCQLEDRITTKQAATAA